MTVLFSGKIIVLRFDCIFQWQDHCVEMYTGERQVGKWANAQCGSFKGYLCEATRSKSK